MDCDGSVASRLARVETTSSDLISCACNDTNAETAPPHAHYYYYYYYNYNYYYNYSSGNQGTIVAHLTSTTSRPRHHQHTSVAISSN